MATHSSVSHRPFGTTTNGKPVEAYTLAGVGGASVEIITFGGIITRWLVPDASGKPGDITLGFDTLAPYETSSPYFGALIGRVGNRIAAGQFSVDGTSYTVPQNNGKNSLHGGKVGYDKRVWTAEIASATEPALRLTLIDPDGSEGYPGTVNVEVIYTLTADNTLRVAYKATADKSTPINLTHHAYFNLKDGGKSSIYDHTLQIEADAFTPVNAELIPTGEIAPVKGTPIDFTSAKPMGKDLKAMGGEPVGYDHNLVLRSQDGSLARAATVTEPTTGRRMEVWTTEPGVQFYSGNFLDGKVSGKAGVAYQMHSAFCLETQHYPDAVNQPKFPNTILRPGETYRSVTEHRFGLK